MYAPLRLVLSDHRSTQIEVQYAYWVTQIDRQNAEGGKSVDLGGRRIMKKKKGETGDAHRHEQHHVEHHMTTMNLLGCPFP